MSKTTELNQDTRRGHYQQPIGIQSHPPCQKDIAQLFYALRVLRHHGLTETDLCSLLCERRVAFAMRYSRGVARVKLLTTSKSSRRVFETQNYIGDAVSARPNCRTFILEESDGQLFQRTMNNPHHTLRILSYLRHIPRHHNTLIIIVGRSTKKLRRRATDAPKITKEDSLRVANSLLTYGLRTSFFKAWA